MDGRRGSGIFGTRTKGHGGVRAKVCDRSETAYPCQCREERPCLSLPRTLPQIASDSIWPSRKAGCRLLRATPADAYISHESQSGGPPPQSQPQTKCAPCCESRLVSSNDTPSLQHSVPDFSPYFTAHPPRPPLTSGCVRPIVLLLLSSNSPLLRSPFIHTIQTSATSACIQNLVYGATGATWLQ